MRAASNKFSISFALPYSRKMTEMTDSTYKTIPLVETQQVVPVPHYTWRPRPHPSFALACFTCHHGQSRVSASRSSAAHHITRHAGGLDHSTLYTSRPHLGSCQCFPGHHSFQRHCHHLGGGDWLCTAPRWANCIMSGVLVSILGRLFARVAV